MFSEERITLANQIASRIGKKRKKKYENFTSCNNVTNMQVTPSSLLNHSVPSPYKCPLHPTPPFLPVLSRLTCQPCHQPLTLAPSTSPGTRPALNLLSSLLPLLVCRQLNTNTASAGLSLAPTQQLTQLQTPLRVFMLTDTTRHLPRDVPRVARGLSLKRPLFIRVF